MDTGVVGLFLIDSQLLARHFDFDSHMGKIESQTAMRTRINYALERDAWCMNTAHHQRWSVVRVEHAFHIMGHQTAPQ